MHRTSVAATIRRTAHGKSPLPSEISAWVCCDGAARCYATRCCRVRLESHILMTIDLDNEKITKDKSPVPLVLAQVFFEIFVCRRAHAVLGLQTPWKIVDPECTAHSERPNVMRWQKRALGQPCTCMYEASHRFCDLMPNYLDRCLLEGLTR